MVSFSKIYPLPLGRGKGEGVMNGRSNNLRKTKLLLPMKI
jgi:hypothetical protein